MLPDVWAVASTGSNVQLQEKTGATQSVFTTRQSYCLQIVQEYIVVFKYTIYTPVMSQRRLRIDVSSEENPTKVYEAEFLEELEHLKTCSVLRHIQREPDVIENECIIPGWKKVVLPGVNDTEASLLTYYWHVESGRLCRDCPQSPTDVIETPKLDISKIAESLKNDSISLAQQCTAQIPDTARNAIHAAAMAQVAEALWRECEASTTKEDAWSSVVRVLLKQKETIRAYTSQ